MGHRKLHLDYENLCSASEIAEDGVLNEKPAYRGAGNRSPYFFRKEAILNVEGAGGTRWGYSIPQPLFFFRQTILVH
jgi:hypothetical protein